MQEQDVIEYIAQFLGGDPSRARYGKETKEIDNPDPDPVERKMQPKIKVTVETWRTPGGQVIFSGYRTPGVEGEFTPLVQETPKPEAPAASAVETVSAPPTQRTIVERMPDGTIRETPNPNYKPEEPAIKTVQGADGRTYQITVDAQGNVTPKLIEGLPGKPEAAPTRVLQKIGGKTFVVSVDASGHATSEAVEGLPEEPAKPDRITDPDTGRIVERGPDGVYRPVQIEGANAPLPEGAGGWRPDFNKPGMGLFERREELIKQVNAGLMTKAQANDLLKQDYELAQIGYTQLGNAATTLSNQRSQDISQRGQTLSDIQSRRSAADNTFRQGLTTVGNLNEWLPSGSDLGGKAFQAILNMGRDYAASMGGMREVPDVAQYPFVQKYATIEFPGYATVKIPEANTAGASSGAPSGNSVPGTMAASYVDDRPMTPERQAQMAASQAWWNSLSPEEQARRTNEVMGQVGRERRPVEVWDGGPSAPPGATGTPPSWVTRNSPTANVPMVNGAPMTARNAPAWAQNAVYPELAAIQPDDDGMEAMLSGIVSPEAAKRARGMLAA